VAPKRRRPPGSGRFTFILLLCSCLLLGIVARLVFVQIVAAPAYAARATSQRMRDIALPARRGTIYDREGEPLAVSVDARTVYAAPNTIKDKTGAAAALASVLGGSPKDYEPQLAKDTGFVYIARAIDVDKARL
jgi:cell division protein FtsI (penicillin-binding protein 3)